MKYSSSLLRAKNCSVWEHGASFRVLGVSVIVP